MKTISGVIFQQLALVVVFALFCSLLVSLTLVPMLASKLLRRSSPDDAKVKSTRLRRLETNYSRLLAWAVAHKARVIIGSGVAVTAALLAFPLIPVELTPQTDADEIDVEVEMADGTNIAVLHRYLEELEAIVNEHVPRDQIEFMTQEIREGNAEVEIAMSPNRTLPSAELADRLRRATDGRIPGAEIDVDAQSGLWIMRMVFRGSGGNEDVSMQLRGYDLEQAQEVGREIQRAIETLPGVSGVRISRRQGRPEQNLIFDRAKIDELGLNIRKR